MSNCTFLARALSILTIAFASTIAFGAEFRALNFGARCEGIVAAERPMGSVVDPASLDQRRNQVFEFHAVHLGREARIHYFCNDDHDLTDGDYEYEFATYEPAVEYFLRIKPLLIAELGNPAIDSDSPEFKAQLRRFNPKAAELGRYSVLWGFERYSVSLGVLKLDATSERAMVIIKYSYRKK